MPDQESASNVTPTFESRYIAVGRVTGMPKRPDTSPGPTKAPRKAILNAEYLLSILQLRTTG